mmetsp:Transcript_44957/g.147494  ORF Transcript_44957/g.147494 Transcript_44957/m.147494 type:complete len:158 (-) Transcript_44957:357-830(-)
MIQQQRKGGSLFGTAAELARGGHLTRGTTGMMLREGLFCGGYMGVTPVMRGWLRENYPDSIGSTEDRARLAATLISTPVCSFASHPPDTLKTCLQGDVERTKFGGYSQTASTLVGESGYPALWRGLPWRCLRQICAVFIFDKLSAELAPRIFPHAFH